MENKDKYIVDKIRNHREEVDMNALWDHVSPHIPKPKKKRRIAFWIFGGALLFVLSGLFLLDSFSQPIENTRENGNEYASKIEVGAFSSEIGKSGQTVSNNPSGESNSTQIETREEKEIKNQTLNTEAFKIDNNTTNTTLENNESSYDNQSAVGNILTNANEETDIKDAPITQIGLVEKNDEDLLNDKVEDIVISQVDREITSLDKLISDLNFIEHEGLDEIALDKKVDVLKVGITENRIWDAYFLSGGSVANLVLNAGSADVVQEAERLESITEVLGSWHVEAGVGLKIFPRVKLSFGLGYIQIHEKASFETEYLVNNVIETNSEIHRQDGSIENDFSSEIVSGTRYTNEQRFNQLRILSIPVRLAYRLLNVDIFQVDVEGSSALAIHQSYDGFTSFSGNTASYDLGLDADSRFRTGGAIKYGIGLKGAMHLNRRTDLNLRIGFEKLRNITTEAYLIDQQYTLYTLSCGVSHRL